MKAVLRYQYDDARLRFIREHLDGEWELQVLDDPDTADQVRSAIADADVLVSMSFEAAFAPAPRLKLLQLPGAGYDAVDFDAVPAAVAVCNVYEHEIGIAEYLVLVMLEWEIRLCEMHEALKRGRWIGSFAVQAPLHGELAGKTVGFVGYGRIAKETARRLKAFGVRSLACTRTLSAADEWLDEIATLDGLHAMMERADYVAVCCPLTEQTRGLVDVAALDALGPSGVIINVGRGPIIDEDALWETLSSGRLGGAIIDTWYQYPEGGGDRCWPSKHPIHTLDNVIMTPHASGWSAGLLDRRWKVITDNMNRLRRGESLRNLLRAAT